MDLVDDDQVNYIKEKTDWLTAPGIFNSDKVVWIRESSNWLCVVLFVRRLQMKTLNHRLYAKRLWMFCLSIGLYVIHGQRAIKLDLTKFKSNIERANDLMILLTAQHCDWHWPVFFFLIASLDVWWSNLIPPPPPNNNDGLRLRIEEKNLAYYSWTKLWRRASKFVKARK